MSLRHAVCGSPCSGCDLGARNAYQLPAPLDTHTECWSDRIKDDRISLLSSPAKWYKRCPSRKLFVFFQ
jgi:hypothetical protein